MAISIEFLTAENANSLQRLIDDMGLGKDSGYVQRCVDKSEDKSEGKNGDSERITLLAHWGGDLVGFCILNFRPAYAPFYRFSIPEFQDLNTHPDHRRKGVAAALIDECERLARERGANALGLGVGLHAGYGNAQRLYVKKGYVPDGQGVVYDAQGVKPYDIRPVDDELCLMMVKSI